MMLLPLLALALVGCGDQHGTTADAAPNTPTADAAVPPSPMSDAAPDATPVPDAAPLVCDLITFAGVTSQSAGSSMNLLDVGPGAWVSNGAEGGPPGDMLYVEAYHDLVRGNAVTVDPIETWWNCAACVFFTRQCPDYVVDVGAEGNPVWPTDCGALFMLDQGVVMFDIFDTMPAGTLAGTVAPLPGHTTVRLREVNKQADPSTPTGFGTLKEDGTCLEVPALAFNGTWTAPPPPPADAGPPSPPAADAAMP